jgi:hypothetical protein
VNGSVAHYTALPSVGGAAQPGFADFGYSVIGPILADAIYRLHCRLHASTTHESPVVFFCARGGLTIRHLLEVFAQRVGLSIQVRLENLMVSRLAAARTALQVDPTAVASLIEMEWAGRSCADAAFALTGEMVGSNPEWQAPFSLARFNELAQADEVGRHMLAISHEQANLLRRHVEQLRGRSERIMLCDTGVFGSINRYLQVGVPELQWRSVLLFRANYKRLDAGHFRAMTGLVSQSNTYRPWQPQTAALLYWPLIESILEPRLSSVRCYHARHDGHVTSDLEIDGWRERLAPAAGSILAGAFDHIGELTGAALPSLNARGHTAWQRLRKMIVYPTMEDVALLAVGQRDLDFGTFDTVEFSDRLEAPAPSLRGKLATVRASMWPEGELRKQFRHRAGLLLRGAEIARWIRALLTTETNGDAEEPRPIAGSHGQPERCRP